MIQWQLRRCDGVLYDPAMSLSAVLVIAGSKTTSTALSGVVFFLGFDPGKSRILEGEIRAAFANEFDINITNTAHFEYLTALIEEGMNA